MSEHATQARGGRVALVLPGGGARGAYEIGALSVLLPELERRGEEVTLLCGTSVGGVNAALLASLAHLPAALQVKEAVGHWRALRRADVVARTLSPRLPWNLARLTGDALGLPGMRRGSLLDPGPLRRYIEGRIDWDALHRNVDHGVIESVCVVATQLATGRPLGFVETADPDRVPEGSELRFLPTRLSSEHVRASAAIPLVFPPVEVNEPPEAHGYYSDGATRLNTPIKPAVELGADRVIVIGLEPLASTVSRASERTPHLVDVLANMLDGLLVDQVAEDMHRLVAINSFFVESLAVGPLPSARAYRAARGRRPYRRIAYALITPQRRRELGQLAARTYARRYRGLRAVATEPDLLLLGRLLRGRTEASGDLLSFLFFDEEYIDALIVSGRRDARRWLRRHPSFWCSDGAHDFDLDPIVAVREQEAASLDEWRNLRRGAP